MEKLNKALFLEREDETFIDNGIDSDFFYH